MPQLTPNYSLLDIPHEESFDISWYQWPPAGSSDNCRVDFAKLSQASGRLLDIRAGSITEATGALYSDYRLPENFAGAEPWFDILSFYWYARLMRASHEPLAQARFFADLVKAYRYNALAVDVEEPGDGSKLKALCYELRAITGARIKIYTSVTKWAQITGDKSWAWEFDLWVAHWDTDTPDIPEPWASKGVAPIQHQNKVLVTGKSLGVCSHGLDHNLVSKSYLDIISHTEPGPSPELPNWYKTKARVNIRNAPVVNYARNPRGSLCYTANPGELFDIEKIEGDWATGRVYIHKSFITKV